MRWPEVQVETPEGPRRAIAPAVLSVSRATDIPAFHAEWLMQRLRAGYVEWVNPFNGKLQYVSFANAAAIVFWSKNPRPMMRFLDEIEARGLAYYFQFTLNDYEDERFEPGVPPLAERIETFRALSRRIGPERVVWRFDPLVLTRATGVEKLMEKAARVGDQIAPCTRKLVFSFADIGNYRKVAANLRRAGVDYVEFDREAMLQAAEGIAALCRRWGIAAASCAEPLDLSAFGIAHNRCIDDELIRRIAPDSPAIRQLYGEPGKPQPHVKDPGQRPACGCARSKDIGRYNTCAHRCAYCYANTSGAVQHEM